MNDNPFCNVHEISKVNFLQLENVSNVRCLLSSVVTQALFFIGFLLKKHLQLCLLPCSLARRIQPQNSRFSPILTSVAEANPLTETQQTHFFSDQFQKAGTFLWFLALLRMTTFRFKARRLLIFISNRIRIQSDAFIIPRGRELWPVRFLEI